MGLSKYKAVIFDLGGTLMPAGPLSEIIADAHRTAVALSALEEEFVKRWFEAYNGAAKGAFRDMREYIANVCRQMGLRPSQATLDAAADVVIDRERRRIRTPRNDTMPLFDYLKSHGYKTGLITSCGPDVPAVWNDAPYAKVIDVALFSCVEGVNKDDPRIFWLAAHRLKVKPEECLYVADGYRGELANATVLGMHAVQLLVPGEGEGRKRDPWDGTVISSLTEVLTLL